MYLKSLLNMGSLTLHFRNGATLVRQMRASEPCAEAVLWDGTRIAHPAGREGLLEALQEIWIERIYTDGFYRPANGDVIVDAGANVGVFSIYVARQNRNCRVLALEPFAENFGYLQDNVARAGLGNVTCHEMALGGSFGQAQMQPVGTRSLDHVLVANQAAVAVENAVNGAKGSQPVLSRELESRGARLEKLGPQLAARGSGLDARAIEVIPLSGLFDLASAQVIDLLKVDIEGSEREVFAAASPDVLRRIERIAMEYHDCLVPGTLELLRTVLAPTHEIMVIPSQLEGCGILRARRRGLKT